MRHRLDPNLLTSPHEVTPLCDLWVSNTTSDAISSVGRSGELVFEEGARVLGVWPQELELSAAMRVSEDLGDKPTWENLADRASVSQMLHERAKLQPLEVGLQKRLMYLQMVCTTPRLSLRVELERLHVSKARRVPSRAIADLVTRPENWESRTLKSIQPSRVLTMITEDDWNIYENRVAARLIDHLLRYLSKRLHEMKRLLAMIEAGQDYTNEVTKVGYRVRERMSALWGEVFDDETQALVRGNLKVIMGLQNKVMALLDSPLYRAVPHDPVPSALKNTNIMSHDLHYRQVGVLWQLWVRYGRAKRETHEQVLERRQREAKAWDRFVQLLVVRAFSSLRWSAEPINKEGLGGESWRLQPQALGWSTVLMKLDSTGVITLSVEDKESKSLRLTPLCCDLSAIIKSTPAQGEEGAFESRLNREAREEQQRTREELARALKALDHTSEDRLLVWLGEQLPSEGDSFDIKARFHGWLDGDRASLMALSPWSLTSEERLTRVIFSWLAKSARPLTYPMTYKLNAQDSSLLTNFPLSDWPRRAYNKEGDELVAEQPLSAHSQGLWTAQVEAWLKDTQDKLKTEEETKKRIRVQVDQAPSKAYQRLSQFLRSASRDLEGLNVCPLCDAGPKEVTFHVNGPTWQASCASCFSSWGLRRCPSNCDHPHLFLKPNLGQAESSRGEGSAWEDRLMGFEQWARPCPLDADHFSCPTCSTCSCGVCQEL